jgi:hypothetical protein
MASVFGCWTVLLLGTLPDRVATPFWTAMEIFPTLKLSLEANSFTTALCIWVSVLWVIVDFLMEQANGERGVLEVKGWPVGLNSLTLGVFHRQASS